MLRALTIAFFLYCSIISLHAQNDKDVHGVNAEAHVPRGLEVGEKAPGFTSTDQFGNRVNLDELLMEKPVVIIFYRGFWCPVCVRYLSNLQDSLSLIYEKNAAVIAITPETPEGVGKTTGKTGASFTILSDSHEKIMRDYDVWFDVTNVYEAKVKVGKFIDIAANNGQEEARLPVPATFIIDRTGTIVYRQFDLNYRNRASVQDIIRNLPE